MLANQHVRFGERVTGDPHKTLLANAIGVERLPVDSLRPPRIPAPVAASNEPDGRPR